MSRFQTARRLLRRFAPRNDSSLRVALIAFMTARIGLSVWALVVWQISPLVVGNLDPFGEKIVAAFDLPRGARMVFSRVIDQQEFNFRPAPPNLIDAETQSVWSLDGRALSGARAGAQLALSARTVEEVFPYRGAAIETNPLLAPWQRFDANWFLKIAQFGYSADDGSVVYFPFYPILIRLLGKILLGNNLLAASLISNAALVGVLYLLYQLARDLTDEASATRTVAYLAIFPTVFFLFAPYTESLFLFLTLAAFHDATRARWARASIWGALAALTRLQGILLIVPLFYMW
ncbi:MAG: glycosyltransferase family 39 protein, partial [Chloroflexi bacterium]|nr:glycosyltransferase family 39 protein [Chloroflexota bacterium]